MRRKGPRMKGVALLLIGTTIYSAAGGCLPPNFFADLAGQVVSAAVLQVVDTAVAGVLDNAEAP